MTLPFRLVAASGCLLLAALAHADCSPDLAREIAASQHRMDGLHPDKPGQLRVLAADGAEFSAGQVRWMAGRLHKVTLACRRSDQATAASTLQDVRTLLEAHRPVN